MIYGLPLLEGHNVALNHLQRLQAVESTDLNLPSSNQGSDQTTINHPSRRQLGYAPPLLKEMTALVANGHA